MRGEIVSVGTELLLGQITDTNSQEIAQNLASVGVDVYFQQTVGDNHERMVDTFRRAWDRSEVIVVTGGLGPTPDDITREAVADLLGLSLRRVEGLATKIEEIFAKLNRPMPPDNLKQADLPESAVPIEPEGTAPGFYVERDGKLLFALPGVPWEMRAMLTKTVLPTIRAKGGAAEIVSREVLVLGMGESHIYEALRDIVDSQSQPTIAFRAGAGRVRLRLTAKAGTESEALAIISPVEDQIRARLGANAVEGDEGSLPEAFGDMLRKRGLTIAVAESLTGGLIGAELSNAGGASDFFLGSLVCYDTAAKARLAGVPESILQGPGPVSEECAAALAEGAASKLDADLGISATGVAGPAPQDDMPVGTVFVGATFGGRTEVRKVRGYGDRDNIRHVAATAAMDLGRRLIMATE